MANFLDEEPPAPTGSGLCIKARAKWKGPLSQCKECLPTAKTAHSSRYYRPSPILKTLT